MINNWIGCSVVVHYNIKFNIDYEPAVKKIKVKKIFYDQISLFIHFCEYFPILSSGKIK